MARPIKKGLTYFNIDCVLNDKIEYLVSMHGIMAFGVIVKLWQKIYGNKGYFTDWSKIQKHNFRKDCDISIDDLEQIIDTCLDIGIFSQNKFRQYGILTSKGIQERYVKICKEAKRKGFSLETDYDLVTKEDVVNSVLVTEETPNNPCESTQSKVKQSKTNENKVEEKEEKEEIPTASANPEDIKKFLSNNDDYERMKARAEKAESENEDLRQLTEQQKNIIRKAKGIKPESLESYKDELNNDSEFWGAYQRTYRIKKEKGLTKLEAFIDWKTINKELVWEDYKDFSTNFYRWTRSNLNDVVEPQKLNANGNPSYTPSKLETPEEKRKRLRVTAILNRTANQT